MTSVPAACRGNSAGTSDAFRNACDEFIETEKFAGADFGSGVPAGAPVFAKGRPAKRLRERPSRALRKWVQG